MKRTPRLPALAAAAALSLATLATMPSNAQTPGAQTPEPPQRALATFAGGCFWCTEAVYEATRGVESAVSGYSGGKTINPTYEAVCSETTGHAEVVQVTYDPSQVSYRDLLEIHFRTHDPTTLNRQGPDEGTRYRSAVFYHDDEQKQVAQEVIAALTEAKAYDKKIVTEVTPFDVFYPAEDYHQQYFANNPNQGYCRAVVGPKLDKFRKAFPDKLKP